MAEYIDKKQAIDRIASCYCMNCEHSNGILCRACEHQDDMDLIDDMPTADVQPVDRWISVDEALPNSGETVLIYYNNQFYIAKYNGDFAETMPWSSSGHWWGKELISFWQPLPKPPEPTKG